MMKTFTKQIKNILMLCLFVGIQQNVSAQCNPNFTFTLNANGNVSFQSTSTPTNANCNWTFGNNLTSTLQAPSTTYTANGTYTVSLFIWSAVPSCSSSISQTINITSVTSPSCTLNSNFTHSLLANGFVNFTSTSTGTIAQSSYVWLSNNNLISTGSGPFTYPFTNGTYTITLAITNWTTAPACTSTISQVITVSSNTCNLNAAFSFTQNANGVVNFVSTSTGTTANMQHYWNFGDGFNTTGNGTQTHTYTNAGNFNTYLLITDPNNPSCSDSVVVPININTVPCVANSNFTLTQISPGLWNAIPAYPWNVVSATWSWGDNTSTNALYTSHTYSPTGQYTICLTVSVSCGATSTTCSSYFITRMANAESFAMAQVNVIAPSLISVGVNDNNPLLNDNNCFVYPNPSNGELTLKLSGVKANSANIEVFSVIGTKVFESNMELLNESNTKNISLKDQADGIYFVKINANNKMITKKIVVRH